MIRVYDFECEAGHVTEHFVKGDVKGALCTTCGKGALRRMPAPRANLEGLSGTLPGAAMAWERRRAQRMREERRHEERHGTTWIGKNG